MKSERILVTSAWPYVNYLPHLGTVLQCLSADVVARYYRLKGHEVVMVSGSDEHGTPTEVEALKQGVSPKQLADANHARIADLFRKWELSFDNYTRTENPVHIRFVQEHLTKIYNNGYIFTQETEMLYCENAADSCQTDTSRESVPTADMKAPAATSATPAEDCWKQRC